jgi:sec-independent protein translocase protein TatA
MGSIGIWQIAIVAVLVVLLFGRGKISELMGDLAKGIKNFKAGLSDDEIHSGDPAQMIDQDDQAVDVAPQKDEDVKS